MTDKYTEKEIILKLQEPDQQREAFEWIVNTYKEQLYYQIRRMVLSHEDADDLLQNTFIKAWNNLEYFLNECLNFLNKQRAQKHLSIEESEANLLNQLESDPYFDGDQTQLLFEKAIQTLPEKQRIIFHLKYFQDMKYNEISEIMGTSIGALKASYHHAVKKIEEFFKQND